MRDLDDVLRLIEHDKIDVDEPEFAIYLLSTETWNYMNESRVSLAKSEMRYSIAESHLELEDAPDFASVLPAMPPSVVYKANREWLATLRRLDQPSRFDRPRCYREFIL